MSKTWYGHHIETINGDDYVLFNDYLELDKEIDRLNYIIEELEEYLIDMFNKTQDIKYCDDLIKLNKLKDGK